MARMKFLCDADRCIECNAFVTACKNEHEVPWGINRRRVVTINDSKPAERSVSMACMHCTDAPCQAVCPVNCFYTTADGVVLHSKDLCIGCGYCFYACPFGAPQYPQVGNFGSRGKMDKCTYCAGGPEADGSLAEFEKYGTNRLAEGKLPLCAEMCSTKSLLAGDGEINAQIYKERVVKRGYGAGADRRRGSSRERSAAQPRQLGQPDGELGEGGTAAAGVPTDPEARNDPRYQVLRDRTARWPRLAPVPPGHAALGRGHFDRRYARSPRCLLFGPRHGPPRVGTVRARAGAVHRLRALCALDDGHLLHHPRPFRTQHHVRQAVAAAPDRARGIHHLVAVGEICPQLPELPVHARRVHDLPDVDRLERPEQGGR